MSSRTRVSVDPLRALVGLLVLSLGCLLAGGCAGLTRTARPVASGSSAGHGAFAAALESSRPVGRGPRFHPPARGVRADRGATIDGMACRRRSAVVAAAHVELFAAGRVVIVPGGIGVSPPLRTRGARIRAGRCAYPLRTLDPTGLILFGSDAPHTLGDLFDVWGQPLGRTVMAGFHTGARGHVAVFIGGVRRPGDPADTPLAPGSQVTIEVGPHVPPHSRYTFPALAWART